MDTITRRTGIIGWIADNSFPILAAIVFVVFTLAIIAAAERDAHRVEMQRELAYSAWCKMEHRTDISYDEWNALRQTGTLSKK